ncbi:MAG: DUF362 domain-containing protein, partial [Pseudomonadota bacterium]
MKPDPHASRPQAPPSDPDQGRRDFLRRAAVVGLGLAATGGLGWGLYDPTGPATSEPRAAAVQVPDFSLAAEKGRMAIVHGSNRTAALRAGLEAVGGLKRFIQPGDRVLIKVNAGFATPPSLGATTNPEIFAELVRLCREAGAASVAVTDNPINDPRSCFQLTGLGQAAADSGADLWLPETRFFRPATVEGASLIRSWPVLYEPLAAANKVIGLSPVKDHHRSGASLAMKNWYGLLGGRRNIFHQDINTIIAELALMMRPTLVILDGVVSMQSNGPTGGSPDDLKATETLIVSTDQVAADARASLLLGRTPADLPFIAKAASLGLGTSDWQSL